MNVYYDCDCGWSLELSMNELLTILNDNPDKSKENGIIFLKMKDIIYSCNGDFTPKQYQWIRSKLFYILRHNDKYKEYRTDFKKLEAFYMIPEIKPLIYGFDIYPKGCKTYKVDDYPNSTS